jgi:hypothetical protein
MEWTFKGEVISELPEGCVGFVYEITNTLTGKGYIGKKLATFSRTKTVKGKKKKVKVASDWLTYYGSNDALKADVVKHGEEHFERKILHLCYTKTDCNYLEAREQFERRVLEDPDRWYNGWIMVRVRASQLKLEK